MDIFACEETGGLIQVLFAQHYHDTMFFDQRRKPLNRLNQKRLLARNFKKLLGFGSSAYRPESRARASSHYDYLHILLLIGSFVKNPPAALPACATHADRRGIPRHCSVVVTTPHCSGLVHLIIWSFFLCRANLKPVRVHYCVKDQKTP
jgi:hypothetical protein